MKPFDAVPSGRRIPMAMVWVAAAMLSFAGAASGDPGPKPSSPGAGACSESCDRKASECLDACDAKFKDDKPRVECKVQCAADRQKCESACAPTRRSPREI